MTALAATVRAWLPRGDAIAEDAWRRRHRLLVLVTVVHAPALLAYGLVRGYAPGHVLLEVLAPLVVLAAALPSRVPRAWRSTAASVALLSDSALLVHLSGGLIEAHFHFFVVLPLVAMYQQWRPFLTGVAFVALHHGIAGALDPESVYNHPAAIADPWTWAGIHALFVLGECLALFRLWSEMEATHDQVLAERQKVLEQGVQIRHLERSNADRAHLLRVTSHELNTPLTPIRLQLARLRTPPGVESKEELLRALEVIDRNVQRLQGVIRDALDAVRVEGAHIPIYPAPTSLGQVVRAALDGRAEQARLRGILLVGEVEDEEVYADPARLEQVLDNLVANAIQFSPGGGEVRVRTESGGPSVRVLVADHGVGLDEEQRASLFRPFGHVHPDLEMDGTGMGLFISRGIVEQHGGTMDVTSAGPGLGSTFWFTLPRRGPTAPAGTVIMGPPVAAP